MSVIIAWIAAHEVLLAGAVVGILDLVFALVPSWQSNGLLHWVYVMLKKMVKP